MKGGYIAEFTFNVTFGLWNDLIIFFSVLANSGNAYGEFCAFAEFTVFFNFPAINIYHSFGEE
jgi:hypothetical protein